MSTSVNKIRLPQPLVDSARRIGRLADSTLRSRTTAPAGDGSGHDDQVLSGAIAYVRDRLTQKSPADAVTLANAITDPPYASAILHALIAFKNGDLATAWAQLSAVPAVRWATHIPAEGTRCALSCEPEVAKTALRDLAELQPDALPVQSWYHLTGGALGVHDLELARALYSRFSEAVELAPTEWRDARKQLDWLRPWIDGNGPHPTPQPNADHVSVGVLAFGSPERKSASRNLGDPVQSMAALGHLLRHRVNLHGDPELVDALNFLQEQVPDDLRRDTSADVDVHIVDRDASRMNDVPANTWMLVIGWWMYPVFGLDYQIPLNDNIKPIILSFYCRHPSFLTPQAVDYLQRNGPVGCRDWTTVDLLLKAGVPAFFSGCITSTVSTVFQRNRIVDREETLYVEAPDTPEGAVTADQMDDAMRDQTPAEQFRRVHAMLDGYRHFPKIRTKRLHCYMPMRSLGADVDFLPGNPADFRFPGLGGIDDTQFATMRDGINDLVEPVMSAILQGGDEASIRRLWRELTADRVAAAREQFDAPIGSLPAIADDADRIRRARTAIRTVWQGSEVDRPGTVTIATTISRAQLGPFQVLLNSVMSRTSKPVEWLVIATDVPAGSLNKTSALGRLAALYDNLTLRTVKSTEVPKAAMTLSLPDLLDADRIVQLAAEAVVLGDIAELAEVSFDGKPAAASTATSAVFGSGMEELRRAATQLRDREVARELRREALIRQPRDLRSLRSEILVLNANRLREEQTGQLARQYARQVRLSNRHQILLLIGADHAALPDQWAVTAGPGELPAETRFLYFTDAPKPWQPGIGHHAATWIAERDASRSSRAASTSS